MTNVEGTAQLSGDEAAAHAENNSFELLWTAPAHLGTFGIHPPEVQARLTGLIGV
jgi:hypothetical protein